MALLDEETLLKYNLGGDRSAGYTGTTYGAGGSGIIPNLQGLQSYNLGNTSGMMSDPLKVAASFKPKVSDTPSGFGFNNETLTAGGTALKGLGSVFQALMAYKNYGLAKDMMQDSKDAFNINTANQTALTNDRIRDVNAFKIANNMNNTGSLLKNYQLPGGSQTYST
jgi:hypothetical protein